MHSEVLQIKKEEEDIDHVQLDHSNLKIHSEVLENEKEEKNFDQAQHDDSEYVTELKRKLKIVTDENRTLRSQLSVLTSFLKENQFSVRTYKNN